MAPKIATSIETRSKWKEKALKPVSWRQTKPPTSAPTKPSAMSTKHPSPSLLTTLLAMKPVISPKKIQPNMDMCGAPLAIRFYLAPATGFDAMPEGGACATGFCAVCGGGGGGGP